MSDPTSPNLALKTRWRLAKRIAKWGAIGAGIVAYFGLAIFLTIQFPQDLVLTCATVALAPATVLLGVVTTVQTVQHFRQRK